MASSIKMRINIIISSVMNGVLRSDPDEIPEVRVASPGPHVEPA
jgi:hypothetical protein